VGRCLSLDSVAMRALTLAFVGAKREGDRRERIADLIWLTYKVSIGAWGGGGSSSAPPAL
jgi:hypothetical protein